ncbi:MAG: M20/M25/M40 family metallo-hydrolase [Deltaproteobacteria bacterium]|nr:M20/M25/M40 family metallo-hydrolase [Deltaproteobacteria bacterium]
MDVVELAKELISIDSTTGREGHVSALIAERLKQNGWIVTTQPIPGGDPSIREDRMNVLALSDESGPPDLIVTTHVDTVPPFFPLTERDGRLFGRGSCDAKGILAAEWVAIERLRARGFERVGLLAVVGEETNSIGAKRAPELLPKARYLIDGEPTRLIPASAMKGVLGFRATAKGVAGHSAYPERGHSAVHEIVRGLARLIEEVMPGEPEFGATTVNVGLVEGGAAMNVIAPAARAEIMIRLATASEKVLERARAALGPGVEIEIHTCAEPRRIHVPLGFQGEPVSFGSDVPYLSAIGTTLLVGPGSIHDAHTDHESIGKDELLAAVDLYERLGERLLQAGARATPRA